MGKNDGETFEINLNWKEEVEEVVYEWDRLFLYVVFRKPLSEPKRES